MKSTIAIVIPVYNESDVISELLNRLRKVCSTVENCQFEFIFVNDGSKDNTLELIYQEHTKDNSIKIIDLSRNFGHQQAISAGINVVQADACITMDADLQDPPELIPELIKSWESGNNVVTAVRKSRAESGLKGFLFNAFHKLYALISDYDTSNSGIYGLMDKKALESFNQLPEQNRYLPALRSWIGFKQGEVFYDRQARHAGDAKQTLSKLFKYGFDAILSFSYKPLRIITFLGIAASIFGLCLGLYFITKRLIGIESAQIGFTTLISMIVFFGGAQLVAIGILGEYIARIYDESKRRPKYFINNLIGFKD